MCRTKEKCDISLTIKNWAVLFTHPIDIQVHNIQAKFEYDPMIYDPDLTPKSTKPMAKGVEQGMCRTKEKCDISLTIRNWAVLFTHPTDIQVHNTQAKFEYDPMIYDPDMTPKSTKPMAKGVE